MLSSNQFPNRVYICIALILVLISVHGQNGTSDCRTIEVNGTSEPVISLNGSWKFSMDPPENHWENGIDFSDWAEIQVPGECHMQGFAIRHDRPYVYKKTFEIPADSKGKQLFLDFHGVYSYARVWVNGVFIREHHGGFTRWSCPLSPLAEAGEKVILTVEITDRTDEISYGSGYAKHQIGGILRKVELRALPDLHFRKLYVETDLDDQYRHADLKIAYELAIDRSVEVKFELMNENGTAVTNHQQELESQQGLVHFRVLDPHKWDAEHPYLYTLSISLMKDGEILLTRREKLGFREVELEGNRLLINGTPVKLRGACRHDIPPPLGG